MLTNLTRMMRHFDGQPILQLISLIILFQYIYLWNSYFTDNNQRMVATIRLTAYDILNHGGQLSFQFLHETSDLIHVWLKAWFVWQKWLKIAFVCTATEQAWTTHCIYFHVIIKSHLLFWSDSALSTLYAATAEIVFGV